MDWQALGNQIVKIGAPLLGTAIGGPAGGAIGGILANVLGCRETPADISSTIAAQGDAALSTLTGFQAEHKIELEKIALERARLESEERRNSISQVNETMRAESRSEHWPQYSWRPWNGFLFPIAVILVYFILPIAGKTVPDVPVSMWVLWASVLGVTTLGRNQEKKTKAGDSSPGLLTQILQGIGNK